jgi:central glycolytic genes regulator
MKVAVDLLKRISPEMVDVLEKRYTILHYIYFNQPVGRRSLASMMDWPERRLRTETKKLEDLGLVEVNQKGMRLSLDGEKVFSKLEDFIFYIKDLSPMAQTIRQKYGCKDVIIVPGNTDKDENVKKLLGREAGNTLKKFLKNGDILAVTGGTTMAQVPKTMNYSTGYEDVIVTPGRGSLGERNEIQSNTVAVELAEKLNAKYKLLYIPDNLGSDAMESVINEPGIKDVIATIRKANILLHGIGGAEEIARRRGTPESEIREILKKGAVAEVFGFYFNNKGEIVHTTTSAGLSIKDLNSIRTVIAIAGGKSKAPAIQAFLKFFTPAVFITDEGAARGLLEIEGGKIFEQKDAEGF